MISDQPPSSPPPIAQRYRHITNNLFMCGMPTLTFLQTARLPPATLTTMLLQSILALSHFAFRWNGRGTQVHGQDEPASTTKLLHCPHVYGRLGTLHSEASHACRKLAQVSQGWQACTGSTRLPAKRSCTPLHEWVTPANSVSSNTNLHSTRISIHCCCHEQTDSCQLYARTAGRSVNAAAFRHLCLLGWAVDQAVPMQGEVMICMIIENSSSCAWTHISTSMLLEAAAHKRI